MLYATTEDLVSHLGTDTPDNSVPYLRRASQLVRAATVSAYYDVDEDGLPTDAATLAAFKEATLEQVSFWVYNKLDPRAGKAGDQGRVASKSMGGRSVSYESNPDATTARANAFSQLCEDAYLVLFNAGMTSNAPAHWGVTYG